MQLYVYDHCPFCVKARMIFGLQKQPVTLKILLNDDELTPTKLVGKKMVPILVKDDGQAMGESLDIVDYIDNLNGSPILNPQQNPDIAAWLKHVSAYISKLIMPITPITDYKEFATPGARDYFINKKQAMVGNFAELRLQRPALVKQVNQDLLSLEPLIKHAESVNDHLSLDDIHLFPILRSLTLVKEIEWPQGVAAYRDKISQLSDVSLLNNLAQ